MQSCIYEGVVRHRRWRPVSHEFAYRLFMMYVDLEELDQLFSGRALWSHRRPALAWLRRRDHLGDPAVPLVQAVSDLVQTHTGKRPAGPIRLLTHLRYFGYCFNPVSFYYCFDGTGTELETVIAEITNTPWGERYSYVCSEPWNLGSKEKKRYRFRKSFFVSPFMDMDVEYDWTFDTPGRALAVHMESRKQDGTYFDATLTLMREEVTTRNLGKVLLRYPLMTAQVIGGIHWQALKLWKKRCDTFVHPHQPRESAGAIRPVSSGGDTSRGHACG